MNYDLVFMWILCGIYSLFTIIRVNYRRLIRQNQKKIIAEEKQEGKNLLKNLIRYEVLTFFVWVIWNNFNPGKVPLHLSFPNYIRWIGVGIGGMALIAFLWVHYSLGVNFSPNISIHENQTLITSGPYRWIRHPMYDAFYLLHIAVFVVSANLFIGVTWIGGLTVIIIYRIPREEKMMEQIFGDQYITYKRTTGKLFPKMRNSKK